MKRSFIVCFSFILLFANCTNLEQEDKIVPSLSEVEKLDVPNVELEKSSLTYNKQNSLWTHDGQLFSGYAHSYFEDKSIKEKFGVLNGRRQNESFIYYPDGHAMNISHYHKGKLHGEKKIWSSDVPHVLISQLQYYKGKGHGVQKQWYPTGEIYKIVNLNMDQEEGMQQAFRKNGVLYANYEARNGRIFGLKKAALCFELEDEDILYKD